MQLAFNYTGILLLLFYYIYIFFYFFFGGGIVVVFLFFLLLFLLLFSISRSSECSTTGVTKAVVCVILSVGCL